MKKTLYFGMHRGGSSLLFMLLQKLYQSSGMNSVDVVAEQMNKGVGVQEISKNAFRLAASKRHLVGCFRDVPAFFSEHSPEKYKNIFMVRDPRECVVSWFWAQDLHKNDKMPPKMHGTLDDLIMNGDFVKGELDRVHEYLADKDVLVLKYEDLSTQPVKVLQSILDYIDGDFSRWALDEFLLHCAASQVAENPAQHNRSGTPGTIFARLDPMLLEILNERYMIYLDLYGYDRRPNMSTAYSNTVDRVELDSLKRYMMELAHQNALRMQEIQDLNRVISALRGALQ